ncbi:MAG: hypothetical protein PEGG_02315 [Paraeggerthella hongkongensis]
MGRYSRADGRTRAYAGGRVRTCTGARGQVHALGTRPVVGRPAAPRRPLARGAAYDDAGLEAGAAW